ncbi:MAG: hypothetical protein GEV04_21925 [Actinophytocola sp.]|nr:hypothetical protein [Actinophytocola sp.]
MSGKFRIGVCAMVASLVLPVAQASADEPLPWLLPGSPPLPPDYTVPYLPAVAPVSCVEGKLSCVKHLETILQQHTAALGCDHDAVFADAYLTITRGYIESATDPAYFDNLARLDPLAVRATYERPDRINLRHARAAGGADGPLYKAKLAEIDASAEAAAYAILEATRTTPEANAARRDYCRSHIDAGAP